METQALLWGANALNRKTDGVNRAAVQAGSGFSRKQTLQRRPERHPGSDLWRPAIALDAYVATQLHKAETTALLTSLPCTNCLNLLLLPLQINSRQFYNLRVDIYYQSLTE